MVVKWLKLLSFEPHCDKTNKMACVPSEESDQPGHPPSLIRVFSVRLKKAWVLSYPLSTQGRLWSDWADAQADLSLRCVHTHFVGSVMSRLTLKVEGCSVSSEINIALIVEPLLNKYGNRDPVFYLKIYLLALNTTSSRKTFPS